MIKISDNYIFYANIKPQFDSRYSPCISTLIKNNLFLQLEMTCFIDTLWRLAPCFLDEDEKGGIGDLGGGEGLGGKAAAKV